MSPLLLLSSLLVVPGLIGLALLMEWLETTFAQRHVADDLARLLAQDAGTDIDALEALVATAAEPLFTPRDS
jgi:ABC-type uncharacterized transport system permease subunit